jgi:hypothetical protein
MGIDQVETLGSLVVARLLTTDATLTAKALLNPDEAYRPLANGARQKSHGLIRNWRRLVL